MQTLPECVVDWMSRKGPAEWHGVAANWNWDEGPVPLLWILDQPQCDRATALTIFWAGEGYRQIDPRHPAYAPGADDHAIAERVLTNWPRYTTSRFEFRLPDYARHIHMPTHGLSPAGLVILQPLLISISGQEPYPIYDAGIPAECKIAYLESNGYPVSDLQRRLLADEFTGRNISPTKAEATERHRHEVQESLTDVEAMLSEVERLRRGER